MTKKFVGKFIVGEPILKNESTDNELKVSITWPVHTRTEFKDSGERYRDRDNNNDRD